MLTRHLLIEKYNSRNIMHGVFTSTVFLRKFKFLKFFSGLTLGAGKGIEHFGLSHNIIGILLLVNVYSYKHSLY